MSTVYDLVKDRRIYSIDVEKTVLEAARFMMEHSIGALPVLREGLLVGIFSERDVMNRVVAAGRTPGTTKISGSDDPESPGRRCRRVRRGMPFPDEGIWIPPLTHRKRQGTERSGLAAGPASENLIAAALGSVERRLLGALAQDQVALLRR